MPLVIIFCHNDMLFSNCWTSLLQICGIPCLQICVITYLRFRQGGNFGMNCGNIMQGEV